MQHIMINGADLVYREQGTGAPLVLVHGSASDYRTWQAQEEVFSRQFRTILYSRRFHWPNAKIPEDNPYAMAEQVEDLETLMLALQATPAHLIGHSYGGYMCLMLAMKRPDLVKSLVLIEPPVFPIFVDIPPPPLQLLRLLFSRPKTALSIIKFGATGIGPATKAAQKGDMNTALDSFGRALLTPAYFENLSEERFEQVRVNFLKAEFLGAGFPSIDNDSVSKILAPTLLVEGSDSPAFLHHLIDGLEELLPNTKRIKIAPTSHIVHEDNIEVFNTQVLAFLKGVSG